MNGREEPSFGRRRRRSVPEEAPGDAETGADPALPDPNQLPVEPQDEELGDPEEEGENVKQLLSVSTSTDIKPSPALHRKSHHLTHKPPQF